MDKIQIAEQMRKALQMFAAGLDDEKALEIACVYDAWTAGKTYAVGDFVTYGENAVGDPQLYKVVQAHTSSPEWKPSEAAALYTAIGLDDKGFPVWSQPTGAHDAYAAGDIVNYNGTLYQSTIDANTYAPDVYGWSVYVG